MTATLTTATGPLDSAVSKVKRHVLPLFLVMFIANYIDRVNIGFVNTHLQTDLGLGAAAWLSYAAPGLLLWVAPIWVPLALSIPIALVVSSDLAEVIGVADRILVMKEGRITGDLPKAQATPDALIKLALLVFHSLLLRLELCRLQCICSLARSHLLLMLLHLPSFRTISPNVPWSCQRHP